jgi:hypothetical protein
VIRCALACLAAAWTFGAHAIPFPFTDGQYETSAVALADQDAAANDDSTATSSLPLVTSASVGTTDTATGNGVAVEGVLASLVETQSAVGVASATGQARFFGSFLGGQAFRLHVLFDSLTETLGDGSSLGTLSLLFMSNGVTLLDEAMDASTELTRTVLLPRGALNVFDISVFSEALTLANGFASNAATVTFDVALVPEPAAWLLMLPLLLVLVRMQRVARVARR